MTTTTQLTTVTTLPLASVTALISAAVLQSGAINAPDASGNIIVQGQAQITVPASGIASFVDAPTGYASVTLAGGHFNLNADGTITLTVEWNVTQ